MSQPTHSVPTLDAYWVTLPARKNGRLLAVEYLYAKADESSAATSSAV